MLNSISFTNFRGFTHIDLSDLRPITIVGGKNNAGKSSVLEGIFLAAVHTSPDSFAVINQFRGLPVLNDARYLWEPLFHNLDVFKALAIRFTLDNTEHKLQYRKDSTFSPSKDLQISSDTMNQFISSAKLTYALKFNQINGNYREDGHFIISDSGVLCNMKTTLPDNRIERMPVIQFINPTIKGVDAVLAEWIGQMELQGNKDEVVRNLSIMDPPIEDLTVIAANGRIHIYVRSNNQLLPLRLVGDGLNKLLFIVLSIVENPSSIILIDEVETGFHYSSYTKIWEVIATAAKKYNCQIIATTHSYECISGALAGISNVGLKEDLCYFRIDRDDSECHARRYSDEILRVAINADMEVR